MKNRRHKSNKHPVSWSQARPIFSIQGLHHTNKIFCQYFLTTLGKSKKVEITFFTKQTKIGKKNLTFLSLCPKLFLKIIGPFWNLSGSNLKV